MENASTQLISVIMPCYNASAYVEEAIASVLNQSHSETEIIVVDDGSSDDSFSIVEQLSVKHNESIKLFSQPQSGPYPARNLALKKARGKFIAFLDADDWWREDCLEKLLSALQEKKADVAYCGWQNIGIHDRNPEPYIPPAYETQDPVAAFLKGCPWPIHAALVRRSAIDAVSGFSERSFSAMDYDIWLRILAHTKNIIRVPEVMAYYRWHGTGQISAKKWKQVVNAVQVRRDFIRKHPDMIEHLSSEALYELVDGQLLKEAYTAYWNRDLNNAHKLFRSALSSNAWHFKDLKYILPAIFPLKLFQGLVNLNDKSQKDVK